MPNDLTSPAPIVDELTYRNFAANRLRDSAVTAERYCAAFGGNAQAFQARFEREHNAGARLADDTTCSGCGARGFRFSCPRCEA